MKKFIVRLFVLALLLVGLDVSFGMVMDYMYQQAKSGATSKSTYIANKTNEDILIFGSSRAVHHYNPQIIEDSLGMSCYNCGYDGNGIVLFSGFYQMICDRYIPKVIVYDLQPNFDFVKNDNVRFTKNLRPYFWNGSIKGYIQEIDNMESIKDLSSMYRYNGISIQTMMDFFQSRSADGNGYMPSKSKMVKEPAINDNPDNNVAHSDACKMRLMQEFIDNCKSKGTGLIFVISPMYKRTNSIEYEPMKRLAAKNGITLIDNTGFEGKNNEQQYFSDAVHLTSEGADEYTRLFTKQLRSIIGE